MAPASNYDRGADARRPSVLLLITHLDAGGAQETVLLLAEKLPALGFDVTVAAAPGGSYLPRLSAAGVPFEAVNDLLRAVHPLHDIRAFAAIQRLLRLGRFDVVHTHSSKAGVLGRLAARRVHTRAIVHTSHGLPVNPDMSRAERTTLLAAERIAARAGHAVVAVSEATARELRALKLAPADQIAVIPSGVHITAEGMPDRAEARRALGVSDGPLAGWVGRHFPQKRPELVVLASRRLLERVPDARVVLVGDGPLLERTRREAGDDPRISVLGHRNDIDNVYAAMDVFLLASAWEGLPRTVLEAQAAGVPVVSTRVSGVPEVVRHGSTGLLVEPGDWRGLGDAAASILSDDDLRRRMSDEARRAMGATYSADATAEATAALYERLLMPSARR